MIRFLKAFGFRQAYQRYSTIPILLMPQMSEVGVKI